MGRSAPRKLSSSSSPSPFSSGWPPPPVPRRRACRAARRTRPCAATAARPAARLLRPFAVANDLGGGFLVADTGNDAIRRVLATGVIGTLAGTRRSRLLGRRRTCHRGPPDAPADVAAAPGWRGPDRGRRQRRDPPGIRQGGHHDGRGGASGAAAGAPSATPAYARSVRLSNPQGVAALPGGGFLIADTGTAWSGRDARRAAQRGGGHRAPATPETEARRRRPR